MKYPIENKELDIINSVNQNSVSIVSAETGAGKSTQVPQYLCKAGYNVFVTVPSRTAAVSLSKRVAKETQSELGDIVGYQTAYEHCYSEHTRILYSTEGLQLIKELYNQNSTLDKKVLIIDEVQDWTINIETLIAWVHQKISNGAKTKVVIMSAQTDLKELSAYMFNAPIISVKGKMYDVKVEEKQSSAFISTIVKLSNAGRNILAFVPGKREIERTITELRNKRVNACILPLHADLTISEQQDVFKQFDVPKIVVATNVAQSSITIPDIDAVVDTGLEKRISLIDGVETLTVCQISYSDHIQRKGRAGRTKPGIYVWCNNTHINELEPVPTPEIFSNRIDQVLLRIASIGINVKDIEFFHAIPTERIEKSINTQKILGALDKNNQITAIGKIMVLLPVSVQYSRMIVEAQKRGVLADVATIAAIQECGGIKSSKNKLPQTSLKCDLIADLEYFGFLKEQLFKSHDVVFDGMSERNYYRILELRSRIYDILFKIYGDVDSTGDYEEIMKSCAAGLVEHLYIRENNYWYSNTHDTQKRKLDLYSKALPSKLLLGLPKNFSSVAPDGTAQMLFVISPAIMVTEKLLREVAPQLINEVVSSEFDYADNSYITYVKVFFNGQLISEKTEEISDTKKCRELLTSFLTENTVNVPTNLSNANLVQLFKNNNKVIGKSTDKQVKEWYTQTLEKHFSKNALPNLSKNKSLKCFYATFQGTNSSVMLQ